MIPNAVETLRCTGGGAAENFPYLVCVLGATSAGGPPSGGGGGPDISGGSSGKVMKSLSSGIRLAASSIISRPASRYNYLRQTRSNKEKLCLLEADKNRAQSSLSL